MVPNVDCPIINVIGPDYRKVNGTYHVSSEKARISPSKPTWKKANFDRYIFYYPSWPDWRIGPKAMLATGNYFFKSKYSFKIYVNEIFRLFLS